MTEDDIKTEGVAVNIFMSSVLSCIVCTVMYFTQSWIDLDSYKTALDLRVSLLSDLRFLTYSQ